MDSWNTITHPNTGVKHSIFSNEGRELIKSYLKMVKTHQAGGDYRFGAEPIAGQAPVVAYDGCEEAAAQSGGDYRFGAEPIAGQAPVVAYDGCEEAAAAQVGGDYFLDPSAEPVAGQAVVQGYKQVPNNPPHPTPTDANNIA